jgi:hypothetical protein
MFQHVHAAFHSDLEAGLNQLDYYNVSGGANVSQDDWVPLAHAYEEGWNMCCSTADLPQFSCFDNAFIKLNEIDDALTNGFGVAGPTPLPVRSALL